MHTIGGQGEEMRIGGGVGIGILTWSVLHGISMDTRDPE